MRSHRCGEVTEALEAQRVTLCGWADRRRDHGGVIFVDLRDHTGVVQVVVQPDQEHAFAIGESIRMEFCLRVSGEVRLRPEGQRNNKLATGAIEVVIDDLEILNDSPPLPFVLDEEAGEEIRLTHRYLDLRRPPLQNAIRTRAALVKAIRGHLEHREFIDIETPILTRATPEGARDYLVPSRNHPGEFYALPQSPQIFKQILMMSGMDRYYQIARCFRDEDLRADRQPEFTQLDVEMAFVETQDVLDLAEGLVRDVMNTLGVADLPEFPRMTYAEAIRRFGSDKPDLRNPLELTDVAEHLAGSDFKVFAGPAKDPGGRVAVLKVPGGKALTRKQIDDYAPYVARYGAKGLAWIKVNDVAAGREGMQSPIVKFLSDAEIGAIVSSTKATDGDLLFFGAGPYGVVSDFMGALRLKVGADLELVSSDWQPLWVVDFPMFDWDERRQRWSALHHPFTAPVNDDAAVLAANPGDALSKGYDLVLNGVELGGGSIRIHRSEMQSSVFEVLGIDAEQAQARFGFLLEALRYGCPPHGGIAFGIDRWAALLVGTDSIRDVIAFPKTASASCLMTQAPSQVDLDQLRELHLSVVKPPGD